MYDDELLGSCLAVAWRTSFLKAWEGSFSSLPQIIYRIVSSGHSLVSFGRSRLPGGTCTCCPPVRLGHPDLVTQIGGELVARRGCPFVEPIEYVVRHQP